MCSVRLYILRTSVCLSLSIFVAAIHKIEDIFVDLYIHSNNGKIGTARFACVRVRAFKIVFRKPNRTCTTKTFYGLNWKMAICLCSPYSHISKWHHRKFHDPHINTHTHTHSQREREREHLKHMRCIQQPSRTSNIIVVRPNACIKSHSLCCVRFTCYSSRYEVNVVIISIWHSTFCPGRSLSSIMHNSILRMHKVRKKEKRRIDRVHLCIHGILCGEYMSAAIRLYCQQIYALIYSGSFSLPFF